MGDDPSLLFGKPQSHPEHVRIGAVDHLHNLRILLRTQFAKRGRVSPHDPRAGMLLLYLLAGKGERLVGIAVKIVGETLLTAKLKESRHQIRATHLVGWARHLSGRHPRRPPPIRHGEVRGLKDRAEISVFVRFRGPVRTRHRDPMRALALADPLLHQAQDAVHIHNVDRRPKHMGARRDCYLGGERLHFHIEPGLQRLAPRPERHSPDTDSAHG